MTTLELLLDSSKDSSMVKQNINNLASMLLLARMLCLQESTYNVQAAWKLDDIAKKIFSAPSSLLSKC